MIVSVIAAIGANGVIGDDKGLPWRLPKDLKRFKDLTWGKPIIMGRRTAELIGKPLPGRFNIVLTRNRSFAAEGMHIAHSLKEALRFAKNFLAESGGDEVMAIGGGNVYEEFMLFCDRFYLTIVSGRFPGTVYFPTAHLGQPEWQVVDWEGCPPDEKNPHWQRYFLLHRNQEKSQKPVAAEKGLYPVPAAELLEVMEFLAESPTAAKSNSGTQAVSSSNSSIDHGCPVNRAAIAGVPGNEP
jgi:dihydrofolate reductase